MTETDFSQAREAYERDGFFRGPRMLDPATIPGVVEAMDAVRHGDYATGHEPLKRFWNPGDEPSQLCKIDMPQLCDERILAAVSSPELGQWAAAITGAQMVQVWAVQLLFKPPGTATTGNVGWHQDFQYWETLWKPGSEVFTAWLAISNVDESSGPMLFVPQSHTHGRLDGGDFFSTDHTAQKRALEETAGIPWREVAATMPAGAASFHHRLTLHGSSANRSDAPRRSFAIHLRTEKSTPIPGEEYVAHLDDPRWAPVIYQQSPTAALQ